MNPNEIASKLRQYSTLLTEVHAYYAEYPSIKGSDARPFGDALNAVAEVVNDMQKVEAGILEEESKRLAAERRAADQAKAREQIARNEALKADAAAAKKATAKKTPAKKTTTKRTTKKAT